MNGASHRSGRPVHTLLGSLRDSAITHKEVALARPGQAQGNVLASTSLATRYARYSSRINSDHRSCVRSASSRMRFEALPPATSGSGMNGHWLPLGMDILVLAKAPVAGHVKTRMCPPLTPHEAAALAEAALYDTLANATNSHASRVVLVLEGSAGPWCPPGTHVVAQVAGDLNARLEAAWTHTKGPAIQIGMDTPHASAALLNDAMAALSNLPEDRALLGPCLDGGWWLLGLHRPLPGVFAGVTMSTGHTATQQRRRLAELGHPAADFTALGDLDVFGDIAPVGADAAAVALGAWWRDYQRAANRN